MLLRLQRNLELRLVLTRNSSLLQNSLHGRQDRGQAFRAVLLCEVDIKDAVSLDIVKRLRHRSIRAG